MTGERARATARVPRRAARRTACVARGRDLSCLAVIEITESFWFVCGWSGREALRGSRLCVPACSTVGRLSRLNVDTIQAALRHPSPHPAGALFLTTLSSLRRLRRAATGVV